MGPSADTDTSADDRAPAVVGDASVEPSGSSDASGSEAVPGRMRRSLGVAAVLMLALVLWGGYSHRWPWTGINGHTATLWDWLKLLLLPVAVAVLPIWASRDARLDSRARALTLAALGLFGLVVLAGYLVPWAWTGFVGNNLWDWLNLVALPVAVALIPVARDLRQEWSARHTAITAAGLALAAALVLGGYLASWGWTGFTGNTLWAWLHLLLLPLLLPTVIVPSLTPRARARMVPRVPAAGARSAGRASAPDGTDVKSA